jgi:cell division protein ZapA (FtsZ GTPase activity inhibitor)
MNNEQDVERITILGEELPVRVTDSDGVAREAVELVEDKLQSIQEGSNPPSNLQLALLSSLNLAGELVKKRREHEEDTLSPETSDRLRSLSARLENLLAEG